MTQQITSAEWQSKVLGVPGPVFVDFNAVWCGPCRMTSPIVDEIAVEKAGSADVYKIDVDENPDVAMRYGIDSIPTFIVFRDGQPVAKSIGVQPKERLLALLD